MLKKFYKAESKSKSQFGILLAGTVIMFALVLLFNFIGPVVFETTKFIPFSAFFILPFSIFAAYAILKHKLFDIKSTAIGILTFFLSIVIVFEIIFAENFTSILFNISQFILVLIFGILLIRGVAREIKQREEIEFLAKDLKRANEKLKELDALKSKFMSMATHDLRSPLGAIKGYASMLIEGSFGKLGSGGEEAVRRIFTVSEQMNGIIEDFLNVSRIEQGGMKYDCEKVRVEKLVQEVINEQLPAANAKGLSLKFKSEASEATVNIDAGKIKQIITNLIDNAIKYTPKGSVQVLVSFEDSNVKLSVTDTGIGMTKYESTQLFKQFSRLQGGQDVNKKGTGLGLYIAKQMIEAHKGKIGVSSKGKGEGSTFWIKLPLVTP